KNENHQFNSLKQFLDTINNFIGYARDISKRDEGKEFNKIVGSYQGYSEIQEAKKQWNELTEEFRKITIDNSDKYSKEFADGWISLFTEEHMPHIEEYFRLPEGNRNLRS